MKLFVYAELKDAKLTDTVSAPGVLRWRGQDGAARFDTQAKSTIWGQVKSVTRGEMQRLNTTERPEYRRRAIRLSDGSVAWAFEYSGKDWDALPPIKGGHWYHKHSS